jgi:cell division protease FtsH
LNDLAKNVILWIVVAVVLWSVVSNFGVRTPRVSPVEYSTFLSWVRDGSVKDVVFDGEAIRGRRDSDEPFITYNPETSNTALIGDLEKSGVTISASAPKQQSLLLREFIYSLPILLVIGVWV